MSHKKDKSKINKINNTRRLVYTSSLISHDDSYNSTSINDVTKDFDCLKISILNKASRVPGEFTRKVTLGPKADIQNENGHPPNDAKEYLSKTNSPVANGPLSPRCNITFSIKKILLENEIQRREKVKRAVDQKKKEMEKSKKVLQDELSNLLSTMAIQREKENEEKIASIEAEERQREQFERDRRNELERNKLKECQEIIKKIIPYKESLNAKWKELASFSESSKDKKSVSRLVVKYDAKVKYYSTQMDLIIENAKRGELSLADIKATEILIEYFDKISQLFKTDLEIIDRHFEKEIARRESELKHAEELQAQEKARLKQLDDAAQATQQPPSSGLQIRQDILHPQSQSLPQVINQVYAPKAQETLPPEYSATLQRTTTTQNQPLSEVDNPNDLSKPPPYPIDSVSATQSQATGIVDSPESPTEESLEYPDTESLQIYFISHQFLENYSQSYQDFVQSDKLKKFKFECQKTLNIAINAISHVSREQLIDKYEKLRQFLSGNGSPNILLHPQAEAYSKCLLAQKIVDQGDTTISSKPEMAFPFASIAVALWNDWPDFGSLLIAQFHIKSPFLVPVFLVQRNDQSDDDYYKSLGCKYDEDGRPEKPDQFLKRLGGIMYLYSSIIITKQRQNVNKSHPHGLGNAWRWLAATLNIEPRCDIADICATLIFILLEVTGNDLWRTYPNQFPKLLAILNNTYFVKLKSFDPVVSAPISRLGNFLTETLQRGSIPPPKGQLPPNFW